MIIESRIYSVAPRTKGLSAALAIEAALLMLSISFAWFLSANIVSPAWSLFAFVNYAWMVGLMFRIEPRATVLVLGGMISHTSTIVALIFIEYGSPIPELGTVGTAGPYSSAFVFYTMISLTTYIIAFRLITGPEGNMRGGPMTAIFDRYATMIAIGFIAVVGCLIAWLILRGLITGFPLLAGIDRFQYRRLMSDKVTINALNLKFVIMFALGMIAFRLPTIKPVKFAAGGAAFGLVAIFFLFGDKFFTQLGGLAGFFSPYLYIHHRKVRKYLFLFALGGAAALSLVFTVTWYIYSKGGTMTRAATMERLSGRIVGQGELWYLQARIGAPLLHWDSEFAARNVVALTIKEVDLYAVQQSLGPHYFSNRYAPDKIRNSLLRNAGSVTYTGALEPLGLAMFGWVGLGGLMVLVGLLLALTQGYIAFAITSRSIVSSLFSAYILVQLRKSLTQFSPWVLFSIFSFKWLTVIFVIELGLFVVGITQRPTSRRGRLPQNAPQMQVRGLQGEPRRATVPLSSL